MLTFVTRLSWSTTAEDLDDVRCGNQRNEAWQIFQTATGMSQEVPANHPVLRMWTGYEYGLGIYGMLFCLEWCMGRGYQDKVMWDFKEAMDSWRREDRTLYFEYPPWREDLDVIRSHRSNLLRRDPKNYRGKWKDAPEIWPYIWPICDDSEEAGYKLLLSKSDKGRIASGERVLPEEVMERISNR